MKWKIGRRRIGVKSTGKDKINQINDNDLNFYYSIF